MRFFRLTRGRVRALAHPIYTAHGVGIDAVPPWVHVETNRPRNAPHACRWVVMQLIQACEIALQISTFVEQSSTNVEPRHNDPHACRWVVTPLTVIE